MAQVSYTCGICNASFVEEAMLDEHYGEIHADTAPPLSCQFCGYRFYDADALERHQHRVHTGRPDDRFPCAECGLEFESPAAMEDHLVRRDTVPGMNEGTPDSH